MFVYWRSTDRNQHRNTKITKCDDKIQKVKVNMSGMIKRNFVDRSKETILALHKSLLTQLSRILYPSLESVFGRGQRLSWLREFSDRPLRWFREFNI